MLSLRERLQSYSGPQCIPVLISLSQDIFASRPAWIGSTYLSVMTNARLIHSSTTSYVSPSNSDLPANVAEGPPLVSDEASPLLKPKDTHADRSSPPPNSWSSTLSSVFDVNTRLLRVATSQVFFSAMTLSAQEVYYTNSSASLILTRVIESKSEWLPRILTSGQTGPSRSGCAHDDSVKRKFWKIGVGARPSSDTATDQTFTVGLGLFTPTHAR